MSAATDFKTMLKKTGIRPVHLARIAGVDKASVSRWMKGRIPAERVLDVERITSIPRHELRPDLYPPPADGAAA